MRVIKIDPIYHLFNLSFQDGRPPRSLRPYFLFLTSPNYQPIDEFTLIEISPKFHEFCSHFKVYYQSLSKRFCDIPKKAIDYGESKECSDLERIIILLIALRYTQKKYARLKDRWFSEYFGFSEEYWRRARDRLRIAGIIDYSSNTGLTRGNEHQVVRHLGSPNCWVG